MDANSYFELVKKRMGRYYNLSDGYEIGSVKYDLCAEYIVRNEKYILSKRVATLYSVENRELCYIKKLTSENLVECMNKAIAAVASNIENILSVNEEHMSSTINIILVSEGGLSDIDIKAVQKFKFYKSFAMGLKGWCHIGLVLVDLKRNTLYYNKKGKEVHKAYLPYTTEQFTDKNEKEGKK